VGKVCISTKGGLVVLLYLVIGRQALDLGMHSLCIRSV
jgi:hypothetical protein